MTLEVNARLRRGIALVLAEAKGKQWGDVVALQFLASEARALAKELQKTIRAPAAHEGPHSGKKASEKSTTKAREAAAATIRPLLDKIKLLHKSLRGMSVAGLREIAASAMETAFFADALLEHIGQDADPTALVSDLVSDRDIQKIMKKAIGKEVGEYRDLASPAH